MAISEKYVTSTGAGAHDGSSEANAFSLAEMVTDINAGGKAGNRYNVKNDATYSRTTTTDALTGSGTATSPIIIRGYTTTITDGYLGRSSASGALITTNMPSITYTTGRMTNAGSWIVMESINMSGAPSNPLLQVGAPENAVLRCAFTNSSTNASATAITFNGSTGRGLLLDCDCTLSGASGGLAAVSTQAPNRIIANRVKGGPAIGITTSNISLIVDNLVYSSGSHGISVTATTSTAFIYGNTIVSNTSDGINLVASITTLCVIGNNMITDNGGYGINGGGAANAVVAFNNRTRDNTNGSDTNATDWLAATKYAHVTTDTGGSETDYLTAGSNDYTLIVGSPGIAIGLPGNRNAGCFQNYFKIRPVIGIQSMVVRCP